MDNGSVPADVQPPAEDSGSAWSVPEQETFDASERDILLSLGAAVVARWYDLPRDIQKLLFNTAASGTTGTVETRVHIARFLHGQAHPGVVQAGADLSL